MQIKFHTPTPIPNEFVGKSIIDNIETGIRDKRPLSEKSVKESVIMEEPLTTFYNKEKDVQHPTSTYVCNSALTHVSESPLSVIEKSEKESVILEEPLTTCYNKEKVVQHHLLRLLILQQR